jgi:PH (Pleckstrin Homology) domain-containing protein
VTGPALLRPRQAWLILGGTALFVAGHAAFKIAVWRVVPWSRIAAVAVLGLLGLAHLPAPGQGTCAAAVVLAVAVLDHYLPAHAVAEPAQLTGGARLAERRAAIGNQPPAALPLYCECVFQRIADASSRIVYVPELPAAVMTEYLMPTERVVTAVRSHPISIIRSVLIIIAGTVVAGILATNGADPLIWLLWLALFVWQGWSIATWWRRYFVVTENRLMLITSLVDDDIAMMPLAKMTDMRLNQTTFGRLLGYGEFIVESAGQQQALSRVRFVPYPSQMYQEILSLVFPGK